MKPVEQVEEDGTGAQLQEHVNKMALRQWSRDVHLLGTALEQIVAVARKDQQLPDDVAERYTMSCTLLASQLVCSGITIGLRQKRPQTSCIPATPFNLEVAKYSAKKKDERKHKKSQKPIVQLV